MVIASPSGPVCATVVSRVELESVGVFPARQGPLGGSLVAGMLGKVSEAVLGLEVDNVMRAIQAAHLAPFEGSMWWLPKDLPLLAQGTGQYVWADERFSGKVRGTAALFDTPDVHGDVIVKGAFHYPLHGDPR